MRRLTAAALVAIAFVAMLHWRPYDRSSATPSTAESTPSLQSPAATVERPATATPLAPALVPSKEPAQSAVAERPPAEPVQISIHAPPAVRSGETLSAIVEVKAAQGVRRLTFSVVYKKSILEHVKSSPGAFVHRSGSSVHFEEVSDGTVLVVVGGGVLAGAGSVAVLEFQARKPGVSPLAIHDVAYAGDDRRDSANAPTAYEGSIKVE